MNEAARATEAGSGGTAAAMASGSPAAAAADFPVVFDDPADAARSWELDDMHMPFPLTPLAADYITVILGAGFNHRYERFGGTQRLVGRVWNGYSYFAFDWNLPPDEIEAAEARWTEVQRSRIPVTVAYWRDEAMPELERIYGLVSGVAVDELDADALATAWRAAWAALVGAWQIHFVSILGPYQVLEDLADQYRAAMGPGRDVEALSLVRGQVHELEEVEAGIEELAAMLAASPELRRITAEAAAGASGGADDGALDRAALGGAAGGDAFVAALDAFLATHGHLGQNHDDLRNPSWAEAPAILLANLVRRADAPGADGPAGAGNAARLAEQRRVAEERAAAARAALADKPDELARFESTLGHALEIGYLTEGHNYWIDRMAQARLRTLAMRVGRRLARDGVLPTPADVFFLGFEEVAAAILDGEPRHDLVRERQALLERQRAITPPRFVGVVPAEAGTGDRFDSGPVEQRAEDELKGIGASAGVVRGPARVVLSPDDFGRVAPGDVIVCPASNPSWVPVFAIAGGLITNTGGVLSHAAVVAREFGLPAVVGATGATSRIADGRVVEIDGTAGTVRLL